MYWFKGPASSIPGCLLLNLLKSCHIFTPQCSGMPVCNQDMVSALMVPMTVPATGH